MLAYLLAFLVGSGSFALYMAAFFFPEVHRKQDFVWSGLGMFYALVLFVCGDRITGGLLLGQTASVALLGWFAWQTLVLRRQLTPIEEQTPAPTPEELEAAVQELTTPTGRAKLTEQLGQQLSALRQWGQAAIATTTQSPKSSKACPVPERPYVPLTPADFEAARRDRLAAERQAAQLTVTTQAQSVPEVVEPATASESPAIAPGTTEPPSTPPTTVEISSPAPNLRQTPPASPPDPIAATLTKRSSEPRPQNPPKASRPPSSQVAPVPPRSTQSASPASPAKTTPAPSGSGLFGLLKPKESKSVYVRKQYRAETEATSSDRSPAQVVQSASDPAAPPAQPDVQVSKPYVRKKYREPIEPPQPPAPKSVYVRKKYREQIEAPQSTLDEIPEPVAEQTSEQSPIAPTAPTDLPISEPGSQAEPAPFLQATAPPSVTLEQQLIPTPDLPLPQLDALEVTEEIVEDLLEDLAAEEAATPTQNEPAVLEVEFVGEDEALWAESIAAVMESTIEPLPEPADASETQNWED